MSGISSEEAEELALLLNQICSATLDALLAGEKERCSEVANSLRYVRTQLGGDSEVGQFLDILVRWLEGRRPSHKTAHSLPTPFREALHTMLQEVPLRRSSRVSSRSSSSATTPPISHSVLTQLISAVVAAEASGNLQIQRQLAAQLVNIHTQLDATWQKRLGPLLENLRSVLGGADPRLLPKVPDSYYQNLWHHTVNLLLDLDVSEESASQKLFKRLVHNARFTKQARKADLTAGYLQALMEVERQALASDSAAIVALVRAIRAYLQDKDATAYVSLLEGDELKAWEAIVA